MTTPRVPLNGTRLKRLRIVAGHTTTSLARTIGIGKSHLSNIERGRRGASPEVIKRLAEALGVDVTELVPELGDVA